jgi:hypothetical protein
MIYLKKSTGALIPSLDLALVQDVSSAEDREEAFRGLVAAAQAAWVVHSPAPRAVQAVPVSLAASRELT